MKEGKISEIGTYHQLLANKGAFAEFLIEQMNKADEQTENQDEDNESNAGILRLVCQVCRQHGCRGQFAPVLMKSCPKVLNVLAPQEVANL